MSHQKPRAHLCTVSMCHVGITVQPSTLNGSRDHFKNQKNLEGWTSNYFIFLQGAKVKYVILTFII